MDPAQLKMAARMMSSMSPEDMERMTRMAASMGATATPGAMPVPGGAPAAAGAAAAGGGGDLAAGGGAAGGAGGLPGFGPGAAGMGPEMMADMRRRMQDPEMLKMMKARVGWGAPAACCSGGAGRRAEWAGRRALVVSLCSPHRSCPHSHDPPRPVPPLLPSHPAPSSR